MFKWACFFVLIAVLCSCTNVQPSPHIVYITATPQARLVIVTPEPTITAAAQPASIPLPTLQVMTVDNAGQVIQLRQYEIPEIQEDGEKCGVAFSPDGKKLAAACKSPIIAVWDVASGQLTYEIKGTSIWTSVAFSPDGKILASGGQDQTIHLWNAYSGKPLKDIQANSGDISELAFGPDGKQLAVGILAGSAGLWNIETGRRQIEFSGHHSRVNPVAFSPDGEWVVSGSEDNTARLWSASSGQEKLVLGEPGCFVRDVEFDPSGRRVAGASDDYVIRLWNAGTGKLEQTFTGHGGPVNGVTFNPNGRLIASASNDQSVRLWDARDGKALATLRGHSGLAIRPAFSPDGTLVASVSGDGTVILWGAPDEAANLAQPLPAANEGNITVGLYAGDGAERTCVTAAERMFKWMGYNVARINANTINNKDIGDIDLLYFPGGSTGPYQADISLEGREKIRQRIHSGGCFIGTCAGALFAAEQIVWDGRPDPRGSLGVFPGAIEGPTPGIVSGSDHGICQVDLEPHPITATESEAMWIMYYNGPFLKPHPGAEVDIVGRYHLSGDPALTASEYGAGRVFLTGPHPEWEEDSARDGVSYFDHLGDHGSDWDMMRSATRWCLKIND